MVTASAGTGDGYLVVTTRSRLRSARTFLPMLVATRRIRRQLARAEGAVRWASVVAGPTEFWTITVWRSRHLMQEFMRSEEHGRYLWQVSRWLASFWLMRWRPGTVESGTWGGLALAGGGDDPAAGDVDTAVADRVLGGIPELRTAMAERGVASYRDAPHVARSRAGVEGAGGLAVRIATSRRRRRRALADLRRLREGLEEEPALLGVVVGPARADEAYLLAAFTDGSVPRTVLRGDWAAAAATRWPGYWAVEWIPESEFGHWDGRRLRTELRRQAFPTRGARGGRGPRV